MIDFFTRSGFTPNFYSKACESPMPTSFLRNMLPKLLVQALVHPQDSAAYLEAGCLEPLKLRSQVEAKIVESFPQEALEHLKRPIKKTPLR